MLSITVLRRNLQQLCCAIRNRINKCLWNQCYNELRLLYEETEVLPSISVAFLIKWPVSVTGKEHSIRGIYYTGWAYRGKH